MSRPKLDGRTINAIRKRTAAGAGFSQVAMALGTTYATVKKYAIAPQTTQTNGNGRLNGAMTPEAEVGQIAHILSELSDLTHIGFGYLLSKATQKFVQQEAE